MDVKVPEQVPWRARGGRRDVVGSVVIGRNECKQMVMGVDGGSGGREFLWEVREFRSKGVGCLM